MTCLIRWAGSGEQKAVRSLRLERAAGPPRALTPIQAATIDKGYARIIAARLIRHQPEDCEHRKPGH
jgi:hypothetical protein